MAKNEKTQKTGRIAGTIAELKQVSWPSFSDAMKKLGSVLVITGAFLLVFMGIDALLKWFYSALTMGVVGIYEPSGELFSGYFRIYNEDNTVSATMYVAEMVAAAAVAAALVVAAIVAIIIIKGRKKEDF